MRLTRCFSAVVAVAWLISAPSARAQVVTEARSYESPQHFYFEFKLGPYAPNIDKEFNGAATPFGDIFGSGTDIMYQGELDLELLRIFGTLGIGGTIGYYNNTTKAFLDTSNGTSPSSLTTRSGSDTSISLLPLALLAVYRFDWLASKYRVPVVPFVKAGFNYTFWWIKTDGETTSYAGDKASGGTFGWQVNAGLALMLDVVEPQAAKNLDVELGINHTYLFAEFAHSAGLGSDALNVGDTTWQAGIAFEF